MRYSELQQSQWPLNDTLEVIASHLHLSRHHKNAEEQLRNLGCAIELLSGMHRYHESYDLLLQNPAGANLKEYNFLISLRGNDVSWRHTVEALSYSDAINQLAQIQSLSSWRAMTPSENRAIRLTEKNRN